VSDDKAMAGPILSLVGGVVIVIFGAAGTWGGQPAALAATGILCGLAIVLLAILGLLVPQSHVALGVLVLCFAVGSIVASVGFGFLLAVLGGTGSIVFGPDELLSPRLKALLGRTAPAGSAPRRTWARTPPGPGTGASAGGRTHLACASCGAVNPIQATFCSACGAKLSP